MKIESFKSNGYTVNVFKSIDGYYGNIISYNGIIPFGYFDKLTIKDVREIADIETNKINQILSQNLE